MIMMIMKGQGIQAGIMKVVICLEVVPLDHTTEL